MATPEGLSDRLDSFEKEMGRRFDAVSSQLKRYELALFGPNLREGVVADVHAANVRSRIAIGVAGLLVCPAIIAGLVWLANKLWP